jgi:hypothetical protein
MKCSRVLSVPFFVAAVGFFLAGFPALCSQYNTNGISLGILASNNIVTLTIYESASNAPVIDLFSKTNLDDGESWRWLQRAAPGQTTLVVSNPPPSQAFFMLGITNAIRAGFNQQILDRNDDGSTDLVPMGLTVNFFSNICTQLYVNNNGNVTFNTKFGAYQTSSLVGLGVQIIAPFWADVDTRSSGSDVVTYGPGIVDGDTAFGVDWVNVGYYGSHADRLLSCQLVIIDRSDIAVGDFDMEFNYDMVQWEWGDASANFPPRAGYSDGISGYELPGSGILGSFLDSNPVTGLIYNHFNSTVPGRYIFRFRDGQPLP